MISIIISTINHSETKTYFDFANPMQIPQTPPVSRPSQCHIGDDYVFHSHPGLIETFEWSQNRDCWWFVIATMAGCIMTFKSLFKSLFVIVWPSSSWLSSFWGSSQAGAQFSSNKTTGNGWVLPLQTEKTCAAVAYHLPSTFSAERWASHRCTHIRILIERCWRG